LFGIPPLKAQNDYMLQTFWGHGPIAPPPGYACASNEFLFCCADVVENKVCCPLCSKQYEVISWETRNQPNNVQRYLGTAHGRYQLPTTNLV